MKKIIVNTLTILLIVITVCIVVFRFTFKSVRVSGDSMTPTLIDSMVGYSDKFFYKIFGIQRFDIITANHNGKQVIKRVIGLPGETISYVSNQLYVNGEAIMEDFLSEEAKCNTCTRIIDFENKDICNSIGITLGEDEYLVLGDNRYDSIDSRYYVEQLKYDNIVSKGIIVFGYQYIEHGDIDYTPLKFIGF